MTTEFEEISDLSDSLDRNKISKLSDRELQEGIYLMLREVANKMEAKRVQPFKEHYDKR